VLYNTEERENSKGSYLGAYQLQPSVEAYLDIETSGLSPLFCEITVIGIHLCDGDDTKLIQLVGEDITVDNILEALTGVSIIYTYNGRSQSYWKRYNCINNKALE